jgi:hypothetical protein
MEEGVSRMNAIALCIKRWMKRGWNVNTPEVALPATVTAVDSETGTGIGYRWHDACYYVSMTTRLVVGSEAETQARGAVTGGDAEGSEEAGWCR